MKFINARSACPKAVGSSVATLSAVCTAGMPPVLTVAAVAFRVPVKLMMFREFAVTSLKSDDTLLVTETLFTMLIVSAPPPMSIRPIMRDPDNNVSVSAAGLSLIAVPPVPAIVPELVIALPTPPLPNATMPVGPEMLPVLNTFALLNADIPKAVWP